MLLRRNAVAQSGPERVDKGRSFSLRARANKGEHDGEEDSDRVRLLVLQL